MDRYTFAGAVRYGACDYRGACAGAAGEGDAGPALPGAQDYLSRAADLYELDVGALRKRLVVLDLRTVSLYREGVEVIREDDGVRVAHIDRRDLEPAAVGFERLVYHSAITFAAHRYFGPEQSR